MEVVVDRVEVRELDCGHIYHSACIDGWFRESKICCLCKKDFSNIMEERMDTLGTGREEEMSFSVLGLGISVGEYSVSEEGRGE